MIKISTSILSYEDSNVLLKLNQTDTDFIHIDVMDGKFVDPTAFLPEEIREVSNLSIKPLDVHLMVEDIGKYIEFLSSLNVEMITFHYETMTKFDIADKIRSLNIKCGISLKPSTDIKKIFPILNKFDLVLIMSVDPGYSGQNFMDSSIERIKMLKEEINRQKLNVLISVDGGVNESNAGECIKNGADILVSATYIIKSDDFQQQISSLRNANGNIEKR